MANAIIIVICFMLLLLYLAEISSEYTKIPAVILLLYSGYYSYSFGGAYQSVKKFQEKKLIDLSCVLFSFDLCSSEQFLFNLNRFDYIFETSFSRSSFVLLKK